MVAQHQLSQSVSHQGIGYDETQRDKAFSAEAEKTCYTPSGYKWTSTPFRGTLQTRLALHLVRQNLEGRDASEGHNVSHHKALIEMEDKQFIQSEKVAFADSYTLDKNYCVVL